MGEGPKLPTRVQNPNRSRVRNRVAVGVHLVDVSALEGARSLPGLVVVPVLVGSGKSCIGQPLIHAEIRELLRLKYELGRSHREIATSLGIANSTVSDYVRRASAADFSGVTLQLLWLEYRPAHPNGYQYSWFCERYKAWRGQLDVVMRQVYRAGEKAFVDYAGPKFPVVDRGTGEVRDAMVFVGVLGASNYTFVDVTWSRSLPDWTMSHVRMFTSSAGSWHRYVTSLLLARRTPRRHRAAAVRAERAGRSRRPMAAAAAGSRIWTGRRSSRSRPSATSTPSGARRGSTSTTTSNQCQVGRRVVRDDQ